MTDDASTPAPATSARPRWDVYRRITAWGALIEFPVVVVFLLAIGARLTGGGPDQAESFAVVAVLAGPAVLAGLVSGSRFFTLYADYSERLDPTAQLSAADNARGGATVGGFIGDGVWGSVIAGVAGSLPAAFGLATQFGNPFFVIMAPILALVIGMAWFVGWVIGSVSSMLLSAAIGMAVGASRRGEDLAARLPWLAVAAFLPVLLVAVVIPLIGTRFAEGGLNGWAAILLVAGVPIAGAEFVLGAALLWVGRIAIWLGIALFAALVVVGTPALLRRSTRG